MGLKERYLGNFSICLFTPTLADTQRLHVLVRVQAQTLALSPALSLSLPATSTSIPLYHCRQQKLKWEWVGCNNIDEPAIEVREREPYKEYVPLSISPQSNISNVRKRWKRTYPILKLAICVHTRELVDSVGDDDMGMGVEM